MIDHTTTLRYQIRRMNATELLDVYKVLTTTKLVENIYSDTILLIKKCYKEITNKEIE